MKIRIVLCACLTLLSPIAHAQSNVTIYGIIDSGIDFVTNSGGHRLTALDTGILTPNLFGFKGSEDLCGGLDAVFKLEGQFDAGNGASIGNQFGHEAYVGLHSKRWGELTAGEHLDFMFTSLTVTRYGPAFPVISLQNLRQGPFNALGIPGGPTGAFDFDRTAGTSLSNTVRYLSPDLNGFSFGGMYGFGNQAGSFGRNSSQSYGMDYIYGPLSLDAAYTYVKYASLDQGNAGIRNWGAGGHFIIGNGVWDALYTQTTNTASGARVDVYETGFTQPFGSVVTAVIAYQYMIGNRGLDRNHAHQVNLMLDHGLSKRTDVYMSLSYQRASGDAGAQVISVGVASSSPNQSVVRVGMRHFF
jgi:predicted porin